MFDRNLVDNSGRAKLGAYFVLQRIIVNALFVQIPHLTRIGTLLYKGSLYQLLFARI